MKVRCVKLPYQNRASLTIGCDYEVAGVFGDEDGSKFLVYSDTGTWMRVNVTCFVPAMSEDTPAIEENSFDEDDEIYNENRYLAWQKEMTK